MASKQPWLVVGAIFIPGAQHPLPKHLEKILPKFNPDNYVLPEDHIKEFILSLRLMNVEHTFQGKPSTWFFILAPISITSWNQFETAFMTQFRDDKTSRILLLEL